MSEHKRDRKAVDRAIRASGVVVVMNKSHIETPEHMVTVVKEVCAAGYIAEVTCRIDIGILKEGMKELNALREAGEELLLGVGSVINPEELEACIEMGFDMIVAPANVMGGYGDGAEFVKLCQAAEIFSAPAILTPTELNYFIERDDGLIPDAIKVFPAGVHGPKGLNGLLAPYVRDRHAGRIIMPTGGVNFETGPQYQEQIGKRGFFAALGMSAPLKIVADEKKPGDLATVQKALADFKANFKPFEG